MYQYFQRMTKACIKCSKTRHGIVRMDSSKNVVDLAQTKTRSKKMELNL